MTPQRSPRLDPADERIAALLQRYAVPGGQDGSDPADKLLAEAFSPGRQFVILCEHNRVTAVGQGSLEVLGWTPEEMLEHYPELIHPDDIGTTAELNTLIATHPGEVLTQVGRMRHRDGSYVTIETRAVNLLDEPSVGQIVVVMREIPLAEPLAHEARSVDRFQAIVNQAADPVVVIGLNNIVTYATPSLGRLLGRPVVDLMGHPARDLVHPEDFEELGRWYRALVEEEGASSTRRMRLKAADRDVWVEARVSNFAGDETLQGMLASIRDITDQVEAEDALQKSERRFRRLVQDSTDVVQIMSATGEVLWVSPAIESVLGWKPEDLVGHPTGGMDTFAGRDQALGAFVEVLDEPGATARTVCRLERSDGTWMSADLVLVNHLQDPDIAGIVATYRDVTDRVQMEDALRASEERFRSLAQSSPLGVFQFDLESRCVYVNERWCEIVGHPAEEAMGHGWRQVLLPADAALMDAGQLVAHNPTGPLSIRGRFRRGDGEVRWCEARTAPLTDDEGRQVGTVGTLDDITDRVESLHETELLTTILESTPDLVGIADRDGRVLYVNEAARSFFGIEAGTEAADADLVPHLPLDTVERWHDEVQPSLRARDTWQGELTLIDREGRSVPVSAVLVAHRGPDRRIEQISANARDISDRKALEARLEHEATHDPLTGLPNRTLLLDRMEMALGRARRQHRRLAVLFLDLDHFKVVNDSLGHSTGDQLLSAVASRLTDHVRPGDTVARFGGDEFVVVCEEVESIYEVEEIARRISASVAEPVWIGDAEVFVTSSVGIALASDLHQTPEQLLRDADAAMYQAKARGRSRHEVFDSRLRTRALDRLEVEGALRRALVRHELRVHYQPTFDLSTGRVMGVEALLRWEHPQRGLLLPAEFLRVAEETGLIVPVGAWVVRQACRQIQRLRLELPSYERLQVAVNLSARQIGHPYLVDEIAKVLEDTGTTPATLVLEITESVLMDDIPTNAATLRRLKDLGVSLAIDDFGTGYSSLAYLRRFPVDILKVDRSFVNGLGADPEDAAIANAVVTLAHTLGLVAVAEGVESHEQRAELMRLGCDQAQGFLMGRPMSAADLTDFLVSSGGQDA